MKLEKMRIKNLVFPEWNPRQISEEELKKLENSIKNFGYMEPIIVNTFNNHIVGGNQRAKALQTLGYEEVEVIPVNIEDMAEEKALNIALNKISGEWDEDKLEIVLEDIELSEFDINLTGFDEIELAELKILDTEPEYDDVIDDNYEEENNIQVNVKEGELYRLGRHYLLCGDNSNETNINKLLDNTKIDMVFTDPPYDYDKDMLETIFKHTKDNAEIFIMHNEKRLAKLIVKYEESFRRLFTVDIKVAIQVNSKLPMTQANYIGHFRKKNPTKFKNLKDHFTTLITCPKTRQKNEKNFYHKHAKNVKLPATFITHYSNQKENILDLFGGSGSTLIACEQLNRNCYMIEIDPYYCQIIINRWEEFTGKKATKILKQ